jgi:hypothetical protein
MVLDGKMKQVKASKKKKETEQNEQIDFTTSVDQVKCTEHLSTIFNILDH